MLALDDKRWALLYHAYGKAGDIPGMILQLRENFGSERKNDLFYGNLCHQNSTYSATFAAVPHIVEIAFQPDSTAENQAYIVIFCGSVHAYRLLCYYDSYEKSAAGDNFVLMEEIKNAYVQAIEKISPLAEKLLESEVLDEEYKRHLFFSFLAFHEQENLSRMFFEFSELDEFIFDCPYCENEIYLWAEDEILVAYKKDPVFIKKFNQKAVKFELSPAMIDWKDWNGEYSEEQKAKWILFLAEKYDIKTLKYQIPYLFGEMTCPHCSQLVKIINSLVG